MRRGAWILFLVLLTLPALTHLRCQESKASSANPVIFLPLPDNATPLIKATGHLDTPGLPECSGIVASRKHPGAFWVQNDSGNAAELFAVDASGKHLAGPVKVEGANNRDWEDLAMDPAGRLIIADLGNNFSTRRDLILYVVPEPDLTDASVAVEFTRQFRFADQTEFPSLSQNFDCEAVFAAGTTLFLFTKHHTDTRTRLYGLDLSISGTCQALAPLAEAEIHGMATAADLSPDGRRVALLADNHLWVFDLHGSPGELFEKSTVRHLGAEMRQSEGVAFDGPDTLLITNEQRDVFRIRISDLPVVRP